MNNKQEILKIMMKINKKSALSQRDLSKDLGISFGKLNYCLKSLKIKGLLKIKILKLTSIKVDIFIF
tara:strand:- start:242 stop:442 length:201 start_codon:yes stop_codon:yes gene_type:complete